MLQQQRQEMVQLKLHACVLILGPFSDEKCPVGVAYLLLLSKLKRRRLGETS